MIITKDVYDMDMIENIQCEVCGVHNTKNNRVHKTICPYAADIHNIEVNATLCDSCYYERCGDI